MNRRARWGGPSRMGPWVLCLLGILTSAEAPGSEGGGFTFEIRTYVVEGNTLLAEEDLRRVLGPWTGPERSAADVEAARAALEAFYHRGGYVSVLVNIPVPQNVEDGTVRLEVIEGRIREVLVTGNRTFTRDGILREIPSLRPGEILYLPALEADLRHVNRNPDLKAAPVLMPGKEPGTVNVELKIQDRLPLHGGLEVNNRSTHETTDLRLNGLLHYDNLWQLGHALTFQFQVSPEDIDEVQLFAGSYTFPVPWVRNHKVAVYALWSDSDTAFGAGFTVVGKGNIVGARYLVLLPELPLPGRTRGWPGWLGAYVHSVSVGLDYKDLRERTGFLSGEPGFSTPVSYLPAFFGYNATLDDRWGITRLDASLNMAFRHVLTDTDEFAQKRFRARGNYVYVTAAAERSQKLPLGLNLLLKADGQWADQPLLPSEQYIAGGMTSVRGYMENEAAGDIAMHGTVELAFPDLADLFLPEERFDFRPFGFYERAGLKLIDPLAGQCEWEVLEGTGVGVRGFATRHLEFEVDWGVALRDTDQTDAGDSRVYFRVRGAF